MYPVTRPAQNPLAFCVFAILRWKLSDYVYVMFTQSLRYVRLMFALESMYGEGATAERLAQEAWQKGEC